LWDRGGAAFQTSSFSKFVGSLEQLASREEDGEEEEGFETLQGINSTGSLEKLASKEEDEMPLHADPLSEPCTPRGMRKSPGKQLPLQT
jgi:hypothetical protein